MQNGWSYAIEQILARTRAGRRGNRRHDRGLAGTAFGVVRRGSETLPEHLTPPLSEG